MDIWTAATAGNREMVSASILANPSYASILMAPTIGDRFMYIIRPTCGGYKELLTTIRESIEVVEIASNIDTITDRFIEFVGLEHSDSTIMRIIAVGGLTGNVDIILYPFKMFTRRFLIDTVENYRVVLWGLNVSRIFRLSDAFIGIILTLNDGWRPDMEECYEWIISEICSMYSTRRSHDPIFIGEFERRFIEGDLSSRNPKCYEVYKTVIDSFISDMN